MQQPDATPGQPNVDSNLVYLALTRDELATIISGLSATGALTLAERLSRILQPPTRES